MDALQFFLIHHQGLHAQVERDLLSSLSDDQLRARPGEGFNSIAWLVWHMARCEDLMSFIIAGAPQVLAQGDWLYRFGLSRHDIGTGMNDEEVGDFTNRVDLPVLKEYYSAVGQGTREMVQNLDPRELEQVPDYGHIARELSAGGALVDSNLWIIEERKGNNKGWWLGQLGLNHNHLHRGEALSVRGFLGIKNR